MKMSNLTTVIITFVLAVSGCGKASGSAQVPDPPTDKEKEERDIYAEMKVPSREDGLGTLAFPGAEGCGNKATGGRNGAVLHVTSLADDGSEGTLRWAVERKGARTVVFDVAGIIALKSQLVIRNGDLTIAGQTAPGDGICLKDANVRIAASNVIIRFIRCRMGDVTKTEDDAVNCYSHNGNEYSDIIIDHCSFSWCTDECASFYGMKGFTLQYCILSESLRNSVHDKGKHGYGGLWGGADASYHHNLLAHHDSRNPRFDHDYLNDVSKGPIHFYNNVIYNWGSNSGYGGESKPGVEPRRINIVGNYYKPGPASSHRTRIVNPTTKCNKCNPASEANVTPGKFYVAGNYMNGSTEVTSDNWKGVEPDNSSLLGAVKADNYLGERPTFLQPAEKAFPSVTSFAGASLKRDAVDARIAEETLKGTFTYTGSKGSVNGLIDTQEDVGGWPEYKATAEEMRTAATDGDGDGIPDHYEDLLGLDKSDASDAAAVTIDKRHRYSNFEMYLHYLVRDIVDGQTK